MASLAFGCGEATKDDSELDNVKQATGTYYSRPNGTGIHIASSQPESWFGLGSTTLNWFMDGFSQHADGTVWANGWYSLDLLLLPADAQVQSVQVNGTARQVAGIHTNGSQLSIDYHDALGHVQTLQGDALVGLVFKLRVPDQLGLTYSTYQLRIASNESIDSKFGDVQGYRLEYKQDALLGLLSTNWSSYCKGANGESQRAVFFQGAKWNPLTGARTDGANLVTTTCESGSVAKCMSWGYRPWGSAQTASGDSVSLLDTHQSCIHMKRASYCGDSQTYTVDGTQIIVNDLYNPPIASGPLDNIEALWTPTGASCVTNRRHPELLFIGCPLPLPTCAAQPSGYTLATGLPQAGSLLGLLD